MYKTINNYVLYFMTFAVEIFRICNGSLFLLILPQKCGANVCTYSELILLQMNDVFYFTIQLLNYILCLLFIIMLIIENIREYLLNKYYTFDDHFFELSNDNLENKSINLKTLFKSKKETNYIDIYCKYNKAINNQLINITELISTSEYLNDLDNSYIYESLYLTMNDILKKNKIDYCKINITLNDIINSINELDEDNNIIKLLIKSIYIVTNYHIFDNDNNYEYIKFIHKLFINDKNYIIHNDINILKNELMIYFETKEYDIINNLKNDFINANLMLDIIENLDTLLSDNTELQNINIKQNKKNYIVNRLKFDNNKKNIICKIIYLLINKLLNSTTSTNIFDLINILNKQLYDIEKTTIDEDVLEKKIYWYHEWLRFLFEFVHILFPINVILSGYVSTTTSIGTQTLVILFTNLFFMFSKIKYLSRIVNSKSYLSSIKTIPYEYNNFIEIKTELKSNTDDILYI
jgi:hypothetical protein